MKRFKTKQEFEREFGKDWRYKLNTTFVSSMDYLFGLLYNGSIVSSEYESLYPNLTKGGSQWYISESMLTDKPHPYEGKSFKMKVTLEESEQVQKKAFALGYVWQNGATNPSSFDHTYLYLKEKKWLSHGSIDVFFKNHPNIELTPQQFMDGDLPDSTYTTDYGPVYTEKQEKESKLDAYISRTSYVIIYWDNHKRNINRDVHEAYKYNLMSEEEFVKKYSSLIELKCGKEIVYVRDNHIEIGGLRLSKEDIRSFFIVYDTLFLSTAIKTYPSVLFEFLKNHKKELNLNL